MGRQVSSGGVVTHSVDIHGLDIHQVKRTACRTLCGYLLLLLSLCWLLLLHLNRASSFDLSFHGQELGV